MMNLFNTLTGKKELFKPLSGNLVTYYSCGPTVYDFAHIGHARTFVSCDLLYRTLLFNGFEVKRCMNITDVGHLTSDADTGEDKMEKGAKREGKSVWDIAAFYTEDFFRMTDSLNIIRPEIITKATDYIPQMIALISRLEKKGFVYRIEDGIYFDTSKFPKYGKLAGETFASLGRNLKAGARVEVAKGKKHITDFALWKLTLLGVTRQMEWDSPWGKGFPGWHIECSAMAMDTLGETLDIHSGGIDHIKIHHTNEIAQSEAATGKTYVRFWLHTSHLLVNGEKMSKSLHNFIRVKDIRDKGIDPLVLRYLYLTAGYRTLMNFSFKSLDQTRKTYENLKELVRSVKRSVLKAERNSLSREKALKMENFKADFAESINDDLNSARAISVLWQTLKSNIPPSDKLDLIYLFDEVLGFDLVKISVNDGEVPKEVLQLSQKREKERTAGNYKEGDIIREKIKALGYDVEDAEDGPKLKRK